MADPTSEELEQQAAQAEREAIELAKRAAELRRAACKARASVEAATTPPSDDDVLRVVREALVKAGERFHLVAPAGLALDLRLPAEAIRHALIQLTAMGEAEFIPDDGQYVDRWRAPRPVCGVCRRPVGHVLERGHCPLKSHRVVVGIEELEAEAAAVRTARDAPPRKPRKPTTCGKCGETGHNARTCPANKQEDTCKHED